LRSPPYLCFPTWRRALLAVEQQYSWKSLAPGSFHKIPDDKVRLWVMSLERVDRPGNAEACDDLQG